MVARTRFGSTAHPRHLGFEQAGCNPLTADALGSTRLVTNESGRVKQRRDYFPFGEEIPASATYGNRQVVTDGEQQTTYNAANGPRQEFTGKERDAETRLDYFGARYSSGAQGLFTSPDPTFLQVEQVDQSSAMEPVFPMRSTIRSNTTIRMDRVQLLSYTRNFGLG